MSKTSGASGRRGLDEANHPSSLAERGTELPATQVLSLARRLPWPLRCTEGRKS